MKIKTKKTKEIGANLPRVKILKKKVGKVWEEKMN